MPVIAYASGAQNLPNESPPVSFGQEHDPVVSQDNLPLDVSLYGNAVDSNDEGAVFTYQWSILAQNQQDPQVALSAGGLAQNVTISNISDWGNIRCFLIATNQNTGETSQSDPLRAPDSAFVTVRVRSSSAEIQKIAAGERNWHNDADEWAQAIEDISAGNNGLPPHTIPEHTDVESTTGADLDVLSGGGYALDPDNPGVALHIHKGDHVDEATPGTRGTIRIEDGAGPAIAINAERLVYTATVAQTFLDDGRVLNKIIPITSFANNNNVPRLDNLCTWRVPPGCIISGFDIVMANGGIANPPAGNAYKFDLVIGSAVDIRQNNMERLGVNLTGSPQQDFGPLVMSADGIGIEKAFDFLGVQCVEGPNKDFRIAGDNLTVTVILKRRAQ